MMDVAKERSTPQMAAHQHQQQQQQQQVGAKPNQDTGCSGVSATCGGSTSERGSAGGSGRAPAVWQERTAEERTGAGLVPREPSRHNHRPGLLLLPQQGSAANPRRTADAAAWGTTSSPAAPPATPAATAAAAAAAPSLHHRQVGTVLLYGVPIVSLLIESQERLCLAQISNTLLKEFSYNEIHNRRVALGITCVQCTPVQLEILRRAGAMPVSSRRCGMITRREAERLCKSFLGDNAPPRLPEDFAFAVHHECAWGCRGAFLPARYNSSRAKCIKCAMCGLFFSPNKFIFHSHRSGPTAKYVQPDAANFNSWRRHLRLSGSPPEEVVHAWEDVKAMFNGGTRKRLMASSSSSSSSSSVSSASSASSPACKQPKLTPAPAPARVPPFPDLPLPLSRSLVMDYVWHQKQQHFAFPPYAAALPWLASAKLGFPPPPPPPPPPPSALSHADLQPKERRGSPLAGYSIEQILEVLERSLEKALVFSQASVGDAPSPTGIGASAEDEDDDETLVDIESTEDEPPPAPTPATPTNAPAPRLWKTASPKVEEEIAEQQDSPAGGEGQAVPRPGLWAVARLSLEHPERALYRSEVARQLHIMRDAHTALQHLSSKMALDCSACHQLYSGGVLPTHSPDAKLAP
ncbi:ski oncogene [Schistocerca serialis cubense]|uniref:ski oncogene n=1 Tax=Schistocerca serialis cubense TaxID=2023355 RepID=UPI00214ED214|nr:ski oncogene [Schistocerca serialis cubense]